MKSCILKLGLIFVVASAGSRLASKTVSTAFEPVPSQKIDHNSAETLLGNTPLSLKFHQPTIVIDPGHPSEIGKGAHGRRTSEVAIAWQIAQKLQRLLKSHGYNVILTKRTKDQFVTNRKRAEIANSVHADLLLRLHCDSEGGSGFATYYPDRQATAQGQTGPDKDILARSKSLANLFHHAFAKTLRGKLPNRGLRTDRETRIGSKQGALTGSVFSKVPVILVEMAVLSNPNDEAFIENPANQTFLVQALQKGIEAAVSKSPNFPRPRQRTEQPSHSASTKLPSLEPDIALVLPPFRKTRHTWQRDISRFLRVA